MKTLIITSFFTIIAFFAPKNELLQNPNYDNLIGEQIQTLIEHTDFRDYDRYIFSDSKPGSLSSIVFFYPNNKSVRVYIGSFNHVTRFRVAGDWVFNNVTQETISRIVITENRNKTYDSRFPVN